MTDFNTEKDKDLLVVIKADRKLEDLHSNTKGNELVKQQFPIN